MKFTEVCLKSAARLRGYGYFSSLKSTCLRFLSYKQHEPIRFSERLRNFIKLFVIFISVPFRLKSAKHKTLLALFVEPHAIPDRTYFLERYTKEKFPADALAFYWPARLGDKVIYKDLSLKRWVNYFRAAFIMLKAEFLALFYPTRINPEWHTKSAQLLLQQIFFHSPDTRIFLFLGFHPSTYLSSYLATCLMEDYHPRIISSNSVLFENNRYLFHPDADYLLCSAFQVEETNFYQQFGWMVFRTVTLWGPEEIRQLDSLEKMQASVDIGLFSSGFWARNDTGWRIQDLSSLPNLENRWYQIFLGMILECIALKQRVPDLRIKLYFHPYERVLFRTKNISPPYLPLLQQNGIAFDFEASDSMDSFYEPRIALSSQSTIIFDRLHYGLESYFYSGREKWKPIAPEYLGKWAAYGFRDMEELRKILEK